MRVLAVALTAVLILLSVAGLVGFVVAGPIAQAVVAAVSALWIAGILCVFPQGLVPLAFNLFGVDPQVRVWFAARYLPQGLRLMVAAGFIVVGLAAIWWAETIRRRPAQPQA